MEDRETGPLEETGRHAKGMDQKLQIALKSVMSKWYASCFLLRLEKEKELEKCKNMHVG